MTTQPNAYNIQILNDIHNYFPDFLYNSGRFRNIADVFSYIQEVAIRTQPEDVYARNLVGYLNSVPSNSLNNTSPNLQSTRHPLPIPPPNGSPNDIDYGITLINTVFDSIFRNTESTSSVEQNTSDNRPNSPSINSPQLTGLPPRVQYAYSFVLNVNDENNEHNEHNENPINNPVNENVVNEHANNEHADETVIEDGIDSDNDTIDETGNFNFNPRLIRNLFEATYVVDGRRYSIPTTDNTRVRIDLERILSPNNVPNPFAIAMNDVLNGLNTINLESFFNERVIVGTPAEVIQTATTSFDVTNENIPDDVCAICQDNIQIGSQARRLHYCSHCFHSSCIDTWLHTSVYCPICRHNIRESQ